MSQRSSSIIFQQKRIKYSKAFQVQRDVDLTKLDLRGVMKNRKTMNYPCLMVWPQVNQRVCSPHWAAQAEYMEFTAVYPLPKRTRETY